jgi:hypothetical protein
VATCRPAVNGRKKTLADEIDRLDAILDGLGEALTEAVAQAVGDAVQRAMADLARPGGFFAAAPGAPAAARSWRDRLRRAGALAGGFIVRGVRWGQDSWGGRPAAAVRRWAALAATGRWRALERAGAAVAGGFRAVPRLRREGPAATGAGLTAGFATQPACRAGGRRAGATVGRAVSPPPARQAGTWGGRPGAVPPPAPA